MLRQPFDPYVRSIPMTAENAASLVTFRQSFFGHFPGIAERFVAEAHGSDFAHFVCAGQDGVARLHRRVVAWLERTTGGIYDDCYAAASYRTSRAHARLGIPLHVMVTALGWIRSELIALADESHVTSECDSQASSGLATKEAICPKAMRGALLRIADFEVAICTQAYSDAHAQPESYVRANLAHALSLYETSVQIAPNLVVALDDAGRIVAVNAHVERTSGWNSRILAGAPFVDQLITPEASATAREILSQRLARMAGQDTHELLMRTASGAGREVRWHLFRIADGNPHRIAIFAVGTDLTESRQAERQLKQNERLAALGTIAAGLAHEIRNPLNGALLHTAFIHRALRDRPDIDIADEVIDSAAIVTTELQRLSRLVTSVLAASRQNPIHSQRVCVVDVLRHVHQLVSHQARIAHIDVCLDVPNLSLHVMGDREALTQVVLNLVHNAIDSLASADTLALSKRIDLRARLSSSRVILDVTDNGPGLVAPESMIFDDFFSTKRSGTGLGLGIAHRIVKAHGGTVDVDSQPGQTCFRVMLPHSDNSATPDVHDGALEPRRESHENEPARETADA